MFEYTYLYNTNINSSIGSGVHTQPDDIRFHRDSSQDFIYMRGRTKTEAFQKLHLSLFNTVMYAFGNLRQRKREDSIHTLRYKALALFACLFVLTSCTVGHNRIVKESSSVLTLPIFLSLYNVLSDEEDMVRAYQLCFEQYESEHGQPLVAEVGASHLRG